MLASAVATGSVREARKGLLASLVVVSEICNGVNVALLASAVATNSVRGARAGLLASIVRVSETCLDVYNDQAGSHCGNRCCPRSPQGLACRHICLLQRLALTQAFHCNGLCDSIAARAGRSGRDVACKRSSLCQTWAHACCRCRCSCPCRRCWRPVVAASPVVCAT